jgi:hypothetical protein
MIHRRVACSLAVACAVTLAGHDARAEPRAVIELFTSQGCSSCPAADKLLAEYARDRSVVALTLAVDYWDYLGWKDTLALAGHTKRQRAYAKVRGDRQVYTPQAVINGATHVLGSDPSAIERAIEQTRASGKAMVLPVSLARTGDKITVNVPAATSGGAQGEVWLCPIARTVSVVINRGENSGRTVTYSNVVRRWIKLGDWTGQAQAFDIALKDLQHADVDAVVVVVQSGIASAPKQMLGAAQVALRK